MIYLDTHVVAWLYAGMLDLIPTRSQELINERELSVSPMVVLELQYLFEIDRVLESAVRVISVLEEAIGLQVCDLSFARVVKRSLGQEWTRDPFDRLIVAQAACREAELVTKDEFIRRHYLKAVWD